MKIKFDQYHISLLTQLFDVTPDTIRHYGKKGILKPLKNDENNYRIFSRDDVFSMEYIMRLRQMSMSLDDIKEILCNDTLEDTQERIDAKLMLLDQEINHLLEIKQQTHQYKDLLKGIIEIDGKPQIKEMTTFLLMDIQGSIPQAINFLKELDESLQPVFTIYFPGTIGIEEKHQVLIDIEKRQQCNLVLTCEDIHHISQRKGFPTDKISILKPSRYAFSIEAVYTGVSYRGVEHIDQFLKESNLQRKGRTFHRYVATQHIHDQSIDYYETWTPIE